LQRLSADCAVRNNMGKTLEYRTYSEAETARIAAYFAIELKPGDIVCMYGDLGSGKTTFCKAALRGLGVKETVTSPTFTIVKEYEGTYNPVYHFDVYRVHSEEDLFEIGFEDYLFGKGICFIEWAELIEDLIPENVYRVYLEYTGEDEGRLMRIEYPGD